MRRTDAASFSTCLQKKTLEIVYLLRESYAESLSPAAGAIVAVCLQAKAVADSCRLNERCEGKASLVGRSNILPSISP
ncbi:uncharacterized protein LOC111250879 isoform X3 [Varroa destructor]|uniref:Uncharacterized protein n=1 Tax=Varroa destructor TaxID=109461 RepID=A0A7M7MAS0_VARDE|nr:uncharacterized protein LOC111250879 isoform X3 [Varroa destructor]